MLARIAGARLIVTDSGGLQEEASWFGVRVVVWRSSTPRWEGVEAGTPVLAGLDPDRAVEAGKQLSTPDEQRRVAAALCPSGDGHTAERVAALLADPGTVRLLTLEERSLTVPRSTGSAPSERSLRQGGIRSSSPPLPFGGCYSPLDPPVIEAVLFDLDDTLYDQR